MEHARIPVQWADFAVLEPVRRAVRIVHPAFAVAIGKAADTIDAVPLLDGAQQFAEGDFPLAAHQIIDVYFPVSFGREARVVPSHDDFHSRPKNADQFDKGERLCAAETS